MIGTALGFFAAGLCHVASDTEDVKRATHNEPPQAWRSILTTASRRWIKGGTLGLHRPMFSGYQTDLALIETMRSAFQKVCEALLLKCDVDDSMTEIIVSKIVAAAKAGEGDAERLATTVIE